MSLTQSSVMYAVPKYSNELTPKVENTDSIPISKRTFKEYLLDEYDV